MINISKDFTWFCGKLAAQKSSEPADPAPVLHWLAEMRSNTKFSARLIPLNEVRSWSKDPNTGDIHHESGQFFSILGVRSEAQGTREVMSWDQPIYGQKEGGVLALIAAETEGRIRFLLNAKAEPGNIGTLQLAPTIQCTWSNLNQAHKGRRPPMAEYVLEDGNSRLIYAAQHNEEGGRFWRKSNSNRIYYVENPEAIAYDAHAFCWATLSQIKNLALIDDVLSPFVKTIIAPL